MPPLLITQIRKRNRIHGFDYSQKGYYFVTICIENMWRKQFGEVNNKEMILSNSGKIVEDCMEELPLHHSCCELDTYVVMPNHVHVILIIDPSVVGEGLTTLPMGQVIRPVPTKKTTLSEIVRALKSYSSRRIHEQLNQRFSWQRSFWDHVIRDERDLEIKRRYILNNPPKWEYDRNNFESKIPMKKRGAW